MEETTGQHSILRSLAPAAAGAGFPRLRNDALSETGSAMNRPRVSVIIPVYNGAADVQAAISSALQQQNCDVEVLAVNDGSHDNTPEILDSCARQYGDRLRVVHQSNQGLPRTRNNAVRVSHGEWIAFLDHDDEWLPEKLERQLAAADATGADLVYTNARNFGSIERVDELRYAPGKMPHGDVFQSLLMDNFLVVSSVMVRRSAFDRAGGFNEAQLMVEDWDLWLRLAASGCRFAAVSEALTRYRWRADSLSKNHDRMRGFREQVVRRALQTERGLALPWIVRRRALASVQRCSAWFLASRSPRRAIRWYAQSICYWPFDTSAWKGIVKGCLGRS